RRLRPPGPNHQTWPEALTGGAGRVRLVQPALQSLGAGHLATTGGQRPLEEEGDHRPGAETAHSLLGASQKRPAVAESVGGDGCGVSQRCGLTKASGVRVWEPIRGSIRVTA